MAVGKILQDNGQKVIYTRTTDVYMTPFQKAQVANNANAGYFLSIHRNSSPTPNQFNGAETLVYSDTGVKGEMAHNVQRGMVDAGFKDLGVKNRPGLVVLRRTKMPAVLAEVGFINSDIDNQIFDQNFDAIANGIAKGVLETFNRESAEPVYYRVQTGVFKRKENAERQLYQLRSQGFPAFIVNEDGYYKVQVGAYRNLDNAVRMEAVLRLYGYPTYLTT